MNEIPEDLKDLYWRCTDGQKLRFVDNLNRYADNFAKLIERIALLEAQVAQLSAPVSDEDIIEANRREPSSAAARVFEMLDAARLSDKERVADAALKLAGSKP